jgi:dihydroorotate dehydrogenase
LRPQLFKMDPERAHDFILEKGKYFQGRALPLYIMKKLCRFEHPSLHTKVVGSEFQNPVGLAAGFDKNAELMKLFYAMGFGFVEVGSVSARPSEGNEKPRLWRLVKEEAVINNMGLPSDGVDSILTRLRSKCLPVGVNISKTNNPGIENHDAIDDILYSCKKASSYAHYLALNISCPNTPQETFEDPGMLDELLVELQRTGLSAPIFVKMAPDYSDKKLEAILSVCESRGVNGYIISNTRKASVDGMLGGISGPPLREESTENIRKVYAMTDGKKPIIGVGGVNSPESAYEKIKAGASLIQLYTALIYEGPFVVRRINKGLVKLLEKDGFSNISQAVGKEK